MTAQERHMHFRHFFFWQQCDGLQSRPEKHFGLAASVCALLWGCRTLHSQL